ncbi:MAG TPA: DUF5818 domain-containing protein [Bryobacteraceae bacterium]|nr:DUF5818 domain-containing protein [Bryobacteraceae bacterium]
MRKLVIAFAFTTSLSLCALAADSWTGYIVDKNCSTNKAMLGNEACAKRCIGRGAPAVLATEDGKVYQIKEQDKVKDEAGKKVTITGKMDGDTISVESLKAM